MQIRAEQMVILEEIARQDSHRNLVEFLRTEMPDETADLSDVQLSDRIRRAEAKAEAHGIESDAGVAQYVCLSFEAGPDFADDPAITAFLRAPGGDPEEQLDELVDLLTDREEVEELIPYAVDARDAEMLSDLRAVLENDGNEG